MIVFDWDKVEDSSIAGRHISGHNKYEKKVEAKATALASSKDNC
jgi:hypothetical protein